MWQKILLLLRKIFEDIYLTNEHQFKKEYYNKYANNNEVTIRNTINNEIYIIEKLSLLSDENKI